MRSTVSPRHVHTNIHPHILTYRSLGAHTQHEIQQGLNIIRLSLVRPNIYCSFKLVLCVYVKNIAVCV